MATRLILIVTGASGVGKTAAVIALAQRERTDLRCFHFDSIGVPSPEVMQRDFGGGEGWQRHACEQWLRRLSEGEPAPLVQVLDAQVRPSFVRAAAATLPDVVVRIVLFECNPETRRARLTARGQVELATERMETWAVYLRGQADALELAVIDTSKLSISEAANQLQAHIEQLRSDLGASSS